MHQFNCTTQIVLRRWLYIFSLRLFSGIVHGWSCNCLAGCLAFNYSQHSSQHGLFQPKDVISRIASCSHSCDKLANAPMTLESQGTCLPVFSRQGSILLSLAISGHLDHLASQSRVAETKLIPGIHQRFYQPKES